MFLDSYINEGRQAPLQSSAMAETVTEHDTDSSHQTEQATGHPLDWDEIITDCDKALAHNAEDVSGLIKRGGAFLNKRGCPSRVPRYSCSRPVTKSSSQRASVRKRGITRGDAATVSDRFSALRRSSDCTSSPCRYCPLRSRHCLRPNAGAKYE